MHHKRFHSYVSFIRSDHLKLQVIPVNWFLINWCWSVMLFFFFLIFISFSLTITQEVILFLYICISQSMCLLNLRFVGTVSLCSASREALRWTIFSMQTTGHILLGSSCYIEQLLEEDEQAEKTLTLPQGSRIRQLQNMLLGKWWRTIAKPRLSFRTRCRYQFTVQFVDILNKVSSYSFCAVTFFSPAWPSTFTHLFVTFSFE